MTKRLLLAAALLLAVGCGEDEQDAEGGACRADFTPCGGDVLGVWTVESGCASMVLPMNYGPAAACQRLPTSIEATYTGGTMEFRADGTAVPRLTLRSVQTVVFEDACLRAIRDEEPSATCDRMTMDLNDLEAGRTGHNECTYGNGACRCVATVDETGAGETDTYEVVGNQLQLMSGGASPICVAGDRLEMGAEEAGAGMYLAFTRAP